MNAEGDVVLYRATRATYALSCVIAVIALLPAPHLMRTAHYLPLAISVSVAALSIVWARSFRLSLSSTEVSYASLLRRARTVRLQTMVSADLRYGYARGESRLLPPVRAVIQTDAAAPLVINLKPFSQAAVTDLIKRLEQFVRID